MAYKGLVTELPCGKAGMVNHENRLLSDPLQLLTAEGITFEDDHVQRERGASLYDTGGLNVAPQFTGVFTGGGISASEPFWQSYVFVLTGSGTPSYVKSIGSDTDTATSPTTDITLTITVPTAAIPVGDLVVVATIANDDDGGSTLSVSDTRGNSWTRVYGDASTIPRLAIWTTIVTTQMEVGDTITISGTGFSTADLKVEMVAVADQFTGVVDGVDVDAEADAFDSDVSVGPLSSIAQVPSITLAVVFYDWDTSTTFTPGSGFTNHTNAATTAAAVISDDRGIQICSRVEATDPQISAIHDWNSDASTTLSGTTVAVTAGSDAVTGTATSFTTEVTPGDRIILRGQERTVESVTNNTALVVTEAWSQTDSMAASSVYVRRGNRLVTATTGGNLFKETPTTLTTGDIDAVVLRGGLTQGIGTPGFFLACGKEAAAQDRKLFYFNGVDPVQVLSGNGTSTTDIATPPTDWGSTATPLKQPVAGTVHDSRVAAWGGLSDPHRMYFSDPDDHEDFTTASAYTIRFRSDIGDRLYCGISFNGILYAWKYPRGIFWLDDSDIDHANWVVRTKSTAIGCAPSPYAALAIDDDIIFCAANGSFHLLSAVDALSGTRASDLTHALGLDKWIRENVNIARLDRLVSVWNQQRKTALFYVPSTNSTTNDLCLKFDFGLVAAGGPVRFSYSQRDSAVSVTMRRALTGGAETPIIGDQTFTYLLDQSTFEKNSVTYTTQVQTPHLDCSWVHPSFRYLRKQFDHLELVFEPVASGGTVTVDVYVDGTSKQTLTYDVTQRREKKTLQVGDGHTISIRLTKSDSTNVKLLSMILYFHATNEDQSR